MRRSLLVSAALAAASLLIPVAARAASASVGDPVGDAPAGHDITKVYYATGTNALGVSVKVRDLATTGRIRLKVSPLDDQAFWYDVVRYQGRAYDACYRVDYSRSGKPVQESCAGRVDHFSYDLRTDRVAIVATLDPDYFANHGPYKLQASAIRAKGQVIDAARSTTLDP